MDRESAYEILTNRAAESATEAPAESGKGFDWGELLGGSTGPRGGRREGVIEAAAKKDGFAIRRTMIEASTRTSILPPVRTRPVFSWNPIGGKVIRVLPPA